MLLPVHDIDPSRAGWRPTMGVSPLQCAQRAGCEPGVADKHGGRPAMRIIASETSREEVLLDFSSQESRKVCPFPVEDPCSYGLAGIDTDVSHTAR